MKILTAIIVLTFFSATAFAQVGELDSTFSGDGKVTDWFPAGAFYGSVTGITIQLDGKILIAGTIKVSGFNQYEWFIKRYNTDGSLDNGFGSGGAIVSGGETSAVVLDLGLQQDGKIVAVEIDGSYYGTVRYNSDGSHDPGFNANSYLWNEFYEFALELQSDGKIVVGGMESLPDSRFILVRYLSDGMLDTSFNSSGIVTTSIGITSGIHSVAIQTDGKILGAGFTNTGTNTEFAISRYNPNGSLDSSFNLNGIVTTPIDSTRGITSIAIQPDGKILVSDVKPFYSEYNFTLVRYNANGALDSTFGTHGLVNLYSFTSVASFALQADGKIVAAGTLGDYPFDFALICLNTDGTVDSSFGINGVTVTDFDSSSNVAYCIGIEPDRKIVIAGNSNSKIELARYLSNLNVGILNFSSSQSSPLIYPNPIQQTETLEYILTQNETLTVALYDINGKLVQSFFTHEPRTQGIHKETLNMSSIPAGNYVLILSNASQKMSVKLVKQ